MALKDLIQAAQLADEAFAQACAAAGYKSRWYWNQHIDPGPEFLREAYRAKVKADNAMHAGFEDSRPRAPYVEVDKETAYGSSVRLSRSIRVF